MYYRMAKVSNSIDKHINKRCAYCDFDLKNELHVVEFLEHLLTIHPEKVEAKDIEEYNKIIKKAMG